MARMRMLGQTWRGVAASFLGMWVVMMVAMMLPGANAVALPPGRRSVENRTETNQNHFPDPENSQRVKGWRKRNPGQMAQKEGIGPSTVTRSLPRASASVVRMSDAS